MFTEGSRKLAIEAMDRLMRHPISTPFQRDAGLDELGALMDARPTSLIEIRRKLEDNGYLDVSEWLDDVENVWKTAELTEGEASPRGIAAAENRRLFAKEKRLFDNAALAKWCGSLYECRTGMMKMMRETPDRVKEFAEEIGPVRVMRQEESPLPERDMMNFIKAAMMINSDEHHREMIKIVTATQPELENGRPELVIDATKLHRDTALALVAYLKTALEAQGMKYPE